MVNRKNKNLAQEKEPFYSHYESKVKYYVEFIAILFAMVAILVFSVFFAGDYLFSQADTSAKPVIKLDTQYYNNDY